jgi:head-tail adaptor
MRAGRLDRRIAVQRKAMVLSDSGQPTETWNTISTRWAYVVPVSGDERFSQPQLAARQVTEFGVRWSSDIADITPLDRIVFPTVLDTSPPTPVPSTSVYDILEVHEIGRREGFKIIAVRRADVS